MPKKRVKPDKPREDFSLSPANDGQWCKKIRGIIYYFGVGADPDAAEAEYLRVREYLQAGRLPPTNESGIRLGDLCNRFLTTKRKMVDTQELSIRTFHDYHAGCGEIIEHFGRERMVDDTQTPEKAGIGELVETVDVAARNAAAVLGRDLKQQTKRINKLANALKVFARAVR